MLREIEEYIKYINNYGFTLGTVKIKINAVKKLNEFADKENINDFNNFDLMYSELYKNYLAEIKLKKATIANYLKGARTFFDYLVSLKLAKTNPFRKAEKEPSYPEELKKYFNEYLSIKQTELTNKNTLSRIRSSIRILFDYLSEIDITVFSQITRNDIKSFISHMIDKKDKKGESIYKAVSINRILFDIRNFFLYLKDKKICINIISAIVNLRQTEKVSRNILTKKEITDLFKVEAETLYQFMMKTIFVCLYSTGLRIGELLSLKIKDIDFENKVISVYEEKTKKERLAHIGEVGINYLEIYMKHARDKIGYDSAITNLVFVSSKEGTLLDKATIGKYLKIFCKKAGITKKVTPHCFRHSYGSHLLENGAGIKVISELLGHAKISSTERYTRLGSENLREIVNTFHPREQEANKWS